MSYRELSNILARIAVPRPNHSPALDSTADYIKKILLKWNVPFFVQSFDLYPYTQFFVGLWSLVCAAVFFGSVFMDIPIAATVSLIMCILVMVVEFIRHVPLVSRLKKRRGENIIIRFVPEEPKRELIFSAHYDSKTDVWDHVQRERVYRLLPASLLLGLGVCGWLFITRLWPMLSSFATQIVTLSAAGAVLFYFVLFFIAQGGYLLLPKSRQSRGAVDDAASVVSLLFLARRLREKTVHIGDSALTILLTSGEEVLLQGARAYAGVRFRTHPTENTRPVSVVNLEAAGQGGNLCYWRRYGLFRKYLQPDPNLVFRLNKVWEVLSGTIMDERDHITDDSLVYLSRGIPTVTIGNTGLPGRGLGGFHTTADAVSRVDYKNIALIQKMLKGYIESYLTDRRR